MALLLLVHEALSQLLVHEALSQLRVHGALCLLLVHEASSQLLVHDALSLLRLWQRGALSSQRPAVASLVQKYKYLRTSCCGTTATRMQRRAVLHTGCICTLVLVKQVN
jgi:hypothetical protein